MQFFTFLAHFAITSLAVFAGLSILLCYEVLALQFYLQSFNLRLIFVLILFVPAQFCRSCQSFLISQFCTQFHFFALVKLHCSMIWD